MGYWRDNDGEPPQARVNRTAHDWAGRAIAQWDPRLFLDASAPANLQNVYSLSGLLLSSLSVDAGVRMTLFAEAGQTLHNWDSRRSQRLTEYDDQLRPLAVFEQAHGSRLICAERFDYASAHAAFAERNQCGKMIRHDDPAGTRTFNGYAITGQSLEQEQYFLQTLDPPDWPLPVNERDLLLEPGAGARSTFLFNPLGDRLRQTDARGNCQYFNQTIDGQLRDAALRLKNASAPRTLVSTISYNAQRQIDRQTSGNGVISLLDYSTQDGRLIRLKSHRSNGEPLQDLNYQYDPVGNILSIEDKALPVRHFANQRIDPINRYAHDSLYQLIGASGYEAGAMNLGPSRIEDPLAVANYRQTYRYDAGGNLVELIHHGSQHHGRTLTASRYSNRCLPELDGRPPDESDIAAGFDANGNLLALEKGRVLNWNLRNQLSEVRPVERNSNLDDSERYIYGGGGLRQRKMTSRQTNARSIFKETRYFTGLEIRSNSATGEVLQVISVEAGRTQVQVLHWESPRSRDELNDQYRFNLTDHLGSCTLEIDSKARIISRESYHPFGSSAFHEGGDSSEASYRTSGYSGKERDATGLYYYGLRYYIPWQQRWTTVDPAGIADGLNLYCMVANRPLVFRDADGQVRDLPEGVVVNDGQVGALPERVAEEGELDFNQNVVGADRANLNLTPQMPHAVTSTVNTAAAKAPRWTVLRYLETHKDRQRTLVVGCGATPQNVTSMGGVTGGACSLGSSHEHDFTVDIDAGANADLTADLVTYRGTDLGRHGLLQFDVVSFEYLFRGTRNPFKDEHIQAWIQAADALLRPGAEAFFFNGHAPYREVAAQELKRLGYSVREEGSKPGSRHGHVFVAGKKPGGSLLSRIGKLF
ncbi:RHS repeat domain-containing protein [Pseudomonas sp. R37(2017)]|uniref:RHS repeat domain-containing protein n=1 Tax=Pseudomonas sp. R37(2017) TaxID=1981685 RepID=UPI00117B03B6|nr:RHS repeat-associated core domain-containing protein [Pseudomonas sp. R37(2017)]